MLFCIISSFFYTVSTVLKRADENIGIILRISISSIRRACFMILIFFVFWNTKTNEKLCFGKNNGFLLVKFDFALKERIE